MLRCSFRISLFTRRGPWDVMRGKPAATRKLNHTITHTQGIEVCTKR